uniref:Neur_chan_LBD domain-containing protein n=1 Tax=Syphacia muris TaxID=451379 RepID=A0A0N5AGS4_9BILA
MAFCLINPTIISLKLWLFLIFALFISPVRCCSDDGVIEEAFMERWLNITDSEKVVKTNFAIILQHMELSRSAESVHLIAQSIIKIHDLSFCAVNCSKYSNFQNFSSDVTVYNGENFRSKAKQATFIINGTILISERFEVDLPCSAHSFDYPFGSVLCIGYFVNGNKNIVLQWDEYITQHPFVGDLPIVNVNDMTLSYFAFPQLRASEASDGVTKMVMELDFVPDLNKIIFLFYFPTGLIVFICWLSFLLGPLINARAIMNVGSLALLYLHYIANIANLPETYGITAIGVWEVAMVIFVIIALLELVVVSFMGSFGRSKQLLRHSKKKRLQRCRYDMEPLYEELNEYRQSNKYVKL